MTRTVLSRLLVFSLAVTLAATASAQFPAPVLNSVFPPGGKQGATIEATISGSDLDGAEQLLFSHPGITGKVKMQTAEFESTPRPVPNQFEVKVGNDVPAGIYEVRAVGRYGTSNPRAFAVGRLDEVNDDGSNKSITSAKQIEVGTTVNGRIDGGSVDYYKISLKQDKRVLIDCFAERIDSRMDATLVVFDAAGIELTRNRDTEGSDPLIDFAAPADGEYIVGVYDFLYRGGGEYFYRLTVHDGPHIDFVFPPARLPGTDDQFTIYGRNLPGGKPAENFTIEGAPLEAVTTNIPLPGDDAAARGLELGTFVTPQGSLLDAMEYRLDNSAPVRIGFARAQVIPETEPNDDPTTATKVTVPCEVAGQFYPARDLDWIEFEAKKGDVYFIEVISQRLGLDSDPYILIQKVKTADDGKETVSDVAAVDDPADRAGRIGSDFDTSSDDPSYRFAVPEDARYRIMVRDQFGDGRVNARYVYRLVIREEQPDFRLVAVSEAVRSGNPNANQVFVEPPVLPVGGSTVLKINVDRRDGFDGEIDVQVTGLPEGVSCPGALISGKSESGWLVLSAAPNAKPWSGSIQVVGKAAVDGQEIVRHARSGAVVWGTTNKTTLLPAFRTARDLNLSVTDKIAAPATIIVGDGTDVETALGAKFELPVKVDRLDDFKTDVKLVATGLPNEIKPGDITIKGDAKEGKVEFAITNAKAEPGAYTFYWKSDVKHKTVLNPDAITIAEAREKEVDEAVKAIEEQVKQADTEKNNATKAAQEAAAALKAAQDAKDEAKIAEAQKKVDETTAAQKAAEDKLKELQETQKRAAAAKQAAAKLVADEKKANPAKDINVALVSTPIRLRIAPSPFAFANPDGSVTVKQGEKAEVNLALEKKFGFDEAVAVTLAPPKGVGGLGYAKFNIDKGKGDGKLQLDIAKDAPVGEHTVTIEGTSKFNNVSVKAERTLVVKVEPAAS